MTISNGISTVTVALILIPTDKEQRRSSVTFFFVFKLNLLLFILLFFITQ